MKEKRTIKCCAYYDTPDSDQHREYSLAAATKAEYVFDVLERLGFHVEILSASHTRGAKNLGASTARLTEKRTLHRLASLGRGGKLKNAVGTVLFRAGRFFRLLRLVKKGDTVWAYHSLYLMREFTLLKKLKPFRLVLEVEEIYSDVTADKRCREREMAFFRLADAYIFPTRQLNEQINKENKPFAISHGAYTVPPRLASEFDDGKIHVVYSGNLDPRKGGAYAAIEACEFLPEAYHMHILGFGSNSQIAQMNALIEKTAEKTAATISYDGVLSADAYHAFLQKCHIGLSTQNPDAPFNATSFPSKILPYMGNGLRIISARIPVVEQSALNMAVDYYDEQTPQAIAGAIRNIRPDPQRDMQAVVEELDKTFLQQLGKLLEE